MSSIKRQGRKIDKDYRIFRPPWIGNVLFAGLDRFLGALHGSNADDARQSGTCCPPMR